MGNTSLPDLFAFVTPPLDAHPFRFLRNLGRSREIATVLLNHGFGDLIERLGLRAYLQWGKRVLLRRAPDGTSRMTTPQRIRRVLEDLGPTFIKFGQVISTRPDLAPPELIRELAFLQEQVPPFSSDVAARALETELGQPVSELFAEFERDPFAAGSLGQVHRARHFDGTALAVKIRRPDVVRDVERDLSLMWDLATLIERHVPESHVFDPTGLVNHFARSIRREVNFRREGRAADDFRRLFRHDPTLYVPRIYHELSSEAILTMEFIDGVRADDPAAIRALGASPQQLALNGARIFMKQAFEMGVFHGDPHPGNIRIRRDGSISLLDYGMIGLLDEIKREQLVDLFVAVARNDVPAAVELVQTIGQPSRPIDLPLLRADVHDFVETWYGIPLEQMRMDRMLSNYVTLLASHGLRCPGDLLLLIRAIVTLDGVGRTLDPEFNLASELAPFVERVVKQRYDPAQMFHRTLADARKLFDALHALPFQLTKMLGKLGDGELRVHLEHEHLERLINEFDRSSNRIVVGLVTSSLVVASALIIRTGGASPYVTIPAFALSGLLGLWLIYGILRSGRL